MIFKVSRVSHWLLKLLSACFNGYKPAYSSLASSLLKLKLGHKQEGGYEKSTLEIPAVINSIPFDKESRDYSSEGDGSWPIFPQARTLTQMN